MVSEHIFLSALLISLIGNAYFFISDMEPAGLSDAPADEMTGTVERVCIIDSKL